MGVAVGDYDNDGFEDILVTGYGGNVLYHNNGNGTFTDVTDKAGVRGSGWSVSAGFFDYNNDGRLDIFITRYLDWTFDTNIDCGDRVPGYRAYCHPKNFQPCPVFFTVIMAMAPLPTYPKSLESRRKKAKHLG